MWKPLSKLLDNFDDFFAETKIEKYIDNSKIERTRTIPNPRMKAALLFADSEVTVKNYEIFGHDLEEEDIGKIQWARKMLSLKSAKRKIDYEIWCSLHINDSKYTLVIKEKNTDSDSYMKNSTTLFEIDNEYHILFMSDTINSIKRTVSNHLISKIQAAE